MQLDNKEGLLLCSLHPYLRFSYPFRPRPESATFLFATMAISCFVIFWPRVTKYGTPPSNRIGRCAISCFVILWPRVTKQNIARLSLESNRSVCDIVFCDFWPRKQNKISHAALESNRSVSAVGNSPPFLTNLPFHDFSNYFNHD